MNISIKLNLNLGYKWESSSNIYVKGYIFDDNETLYEGAELVKFFENITTKNQLIEKIHKVKGIFSVIIQTDDGVVFAVDRTRTFPLFYSVNAEGGVVSDDSNYIRDMLNLSIDKESIQEFLCTGFVTGNKTLIKHIEQCQAGEVVSISNNTVSSKFYHDYLVTELELSKERRNLLDKKFMDILEKISNRIVSFARGRQIVIPLSGGFDSRLVLSLIKNKGYENVVCFTYGKSSSPEVQISKRVAEKLGYRWYFVEYNRDTIPSSFTETDIFRQHCLFSSNNTSLFHLQDYFAINYLNENGIIDNNAIIIPGHTGDFLSGAQLKNCEINITRESLSECILDKHYGLSKYNFVSEKKVEDYISALDKEYLSYSIYENFNLKERQAKFIVNANRVYEFFGYQHMIPLWDFDLVEFFRCLPIEYKIEVCLYNEFIMNELFSKLNIHFLDQERNKKFRWFIKKRIMHKLSKNMRKLIYRVTRRDVNNFDLVFSLFSKKLPNAKFKDFNQMTAFWYVNIMLYRDKRDSNF